MENTPMENIPESPHDMQACLKYESSQQPRADAFYKKQFPELQIERCDFKDPDGRKHQQAGVDVLLKYPDGTAIKVSEKFRRRSFPDIWMEVFRNWEKRTPGWGWDSEPDYYAYFQEDSGTVRWIPAKEVRRFVFLSMNQLETFQRVWESMSMEEEDLENAETTFKGIEFRMVPTWAKKEWWGASICVPMEYITEMETFEY